MLIPLPVLSFLPIVQKEVDRGSVLLSVCTGHPGKHHIWPKCPTEEPWWRPERDKLPCPSLAMAHRQPRHPLLRPYGILLKKEKHGRCCQASGLPLIPCTCYISDSAEPVEMTLHQIRLGLMTACVETQYIVSNVQTHMGKLACSQQRIRSIKCTLAAPYYLLFLPRVRWEDFSLSLKKKYPYLMDRHESGSNLFNSQQESE